MAQIPAVNESVGEMIGFNIRSGEHDITSYDWEQFIRFTNRHFKKS